MKKLSLILLLIASQLFSGWKPAEKGIQFKQSGVQQALLQAGKENKLVFLALYASWCGTCKLMTKKVHPNKKAGELYNGNFVNLNIDIDSKEGEALARKYGVRFTPTFLFLKPDGTVFGALYGYQESEDLLAAGRQAAAEYRIATAQNAKP